MGACLTATRVTCSANGVFQCKERMLQPGLPDLFKAFGVVCSSSHSIEILWDDGMVGIRQLQPIQWLIAVVTRRRSYRETHLSPGASFLLQVWQISDDDVRAVRCCGH